MTLFPTFPTLAGLGEDDAVPSTGAAVGEVVIEDIQVIGLTQSVSTLGLKLIG